MILEPANENPSIMAIAPQQFHAGKNLFEGQEQAFGSFLIRRYWRA